MLLWITLTDARVPPARRPALGLVTGLLVLIGFFAMLLPKRSLKTVAEFFGCKPIESILQNECKVVGVQVYLKQVAIVVVLISLVRFGFEFVQQGATLLGGSMIAAAAAIAFWTWGSMIFKPVGDFEKLVAPVLETGGYYRVPPETAAHFLKHSIVATDSYFEILNFWVKSEQLGYFTG